METAQLVQLLEEAQKALDACVKRIRHLEQVLAKANLPADQNVMLGEIAATFGVHVQDLSDYVRELRIDTPRESDKSSLRDDLNRALDAQEELQTLQPKWSAAEDLLWELPNQIMRVLGESASLGPTLAACMPYEQAILKEKIKEALDEIRDLF